MRPRAIVTAAAAALLLAGCTSSSDGPSSTTPPPTTAGSDPPVSSASPPPSSAESSAVSSASSSGTTSRSAPSSTARTTPAPTARGYLIGAADVGSGVRTTTQVDASVPSLCGAGGRADRGTAYRSTAQIGFFDSARRLLVAEKVNVYGSAKAAAQVARTVLAFDRCGSTAKYNGLAATYSATRGLPQQVRGLLDSGSARDLRTTQARVTFATLRVGSRLVQLTFTSLGGTPPKASVDAITLAAAQRLK